MQYYNNNILCLTYDEFVGFFGIETYKSDKKRSNIVVYGLGGYGRNVLIDYESLKPARKEAIVKRYGNPYEYMAKQPLLDQIQPDLKAREFYSTFVLPNGNMLPGTDLDPKGKPQINYVERYTIAASWLNMINRLTTDKRALKQTLNLSLGDFWTLLNELILKESICIPASYKRLTAALKTYKANGYTDLIEFSRFGNEYAKKRAGQTADDFILSLLCKGYDDKYIAIAYKKWALERGLPPITASAISAFKRNNMHLVEPSLIGSKQTYNKYIGHIQRTRTEIPLGFINGDDNDLDLYFTVETIKDGKKIKNHYYRPKLYVIIDTYNDYILGYAVGDTVTHELVYEAFRNMMHHIYELTGGYYLPHQLQTDNWGLDVKKENDLGRFYKSIAHFTPQSHGNAQAKYIERSFGTQWHQILSLAPNYAGRNITAKNRGINTESLQKNAKNHPSIDDMPAMVHAHITAMRTRVMDNGISKQQQWLSSFNKQEKSKERAIDAGLKLQLFGKVHSHEMKITAAGLKPTLDGRSTSYDLPLEVIYQHNGKKVQITYDPYDLSQVLVTDKKGLRLVVGAYDKFSSALIDQNEGDRARLNKRLEAKTAIGQSIINTVQQRAERMERNQIDAQSYIQAGILTKEINHAATALAQGYGMAASDLPKPVKKTKAPPVVQQNEIINHWDLY